MKIYHWIDKYNEKVCYEITKKYSVGITSGKPNIYFLYFSFWPYYIFRSALILLSFLLLKKDSYKEFYKVCSCRESILYPPGHYSLLYRKTADLLGTWFGFRYLSNPELLPLLGDTKIMGKRIMMNIEESPLVSIIIPLTHPLCYIYNTISSIQKNSTLTNSYEIIVVDECGTTQANTFFKTNTSGINYLKNEEPASVSSWNLGAQYAKGKLICFINDNSHVSKDWLGFLIKILEDPKIGCAGSKIINSNGLLNHAGGIIYSDCSTEYYGKNENQEHPYYNYIRETDYCTGAVIFRKQEFLEIQKEKSKSVSPHLIDIDTCLRIRHTLRKKVSYQPLSSVIQIGPAYKKRRIHDLNFKEEWQENLELNIPSGDIDKDSRNYQKRKTILFVDDVVPAPDQDSGSNRLFKIMKIVSSLGYHIIFVPNDGKKREHYFDQMIQEGFEVLYRFPNRKGMIKVLTNTLKYVDAAWLCKPHNNDLFSFIFNVKQDCIWIYDTIDLHYLRLQREGNLTQNDDLLQSAMRTKEIELSIANRANITIAITQDEKNLLTKEKLSNVIVIPNIHETACSLEQTPGFDERSGLLFIGGYLHKPNIDAAEWLVNKIMPEVWKVDPDIKLTLLGSNPTAEILSYQSENILVPGYIEDVSPYFNKSRVFVAPLRFGAGMKGKIGQSLEYNLPIVSTDIGIEGMGLIDKQHVLVANNTENFAKEILCLYQSKQLWNHIQANAGEALKEYTPQSVTEKLKALFESLDLQR